MGMMLTCVSFMIRGWIFPLSVVMPVLLRMRWVAKLPMVTMTFGCMIWMS